MKCPECKKELIPLETSDGAVCPQCSRIYNQDEIMDILEGEMLEEDMRIWKSVQKFR